ncbi:MAG: TonB-dependent receptor, partial [Pseudomonadota bacterium]
MLRGLSVGALAAFAAPIGAWGQVDDLPECTPEIVETEADCFINMVLAEHEIVLDRVYVTDTAGPRASQIPVTVTLVPDDAVQAQNAIRVGEVLANVPGVFASGLNGPREIVQVRQPLAFDNRVLFLEDGVPLQSSVFFDQSALGYSQALSSPGGIEVLRGPGTALYGSDALSGVVNVRTITPADGPNFGVRARGGEFGLFDLQAEAGGFVTNDHALRGTIAFNGEDGFRDETAFHRAQGVLRHSYFGDDLVVESGLYITDFSTESATSIPFADFEAGEIFGSGLNPAVDPEEAVETGDLIRVQSLWAYELTNAIQIEVTPYWRRQRSSATLTFQPATTPREDATVETFGLLPRFRVEDGDTLTTLGVDFEFTDLELDLVQSRPDALVFGDLFLQGPQFDYQVDYRAISPFIEHERVFGPVTVTLGLRYDDLRYDFTNNLEDVPGDARLQVADRVDRFDAFSPKAAAIWNITDAQRLFARYARGFRVPRASDLYELEDGQAEFELEPEKLDSFELGWRADWGRVQTELIGYWQNSRDGVITDVQTAAGNISVNAGERRFAGVEASATALLGYGVDVQAVFAWQDFRFVERSADGDDPFDGNQIAEAPRTLGNVVLNWTPPFYRDATLTARLRHIGAWPLDDANTLFTDDEYIATLQGEWRV